MEDYDTPHERFSGTIGWVRMEIGTDVHEEHEPRRVLLDLEKAGLAAGARWKDSGPSPQEPIDGAEIEAFGVEKRRRARRACFMGWLRRTE